MPFLSLNRTVLGEGLLATIGPQHVRQRKILNPVFHIKHMRKLVSVFYAVSDRVSSNPTYTPVEELTILVQMCAAIQEQLDYTNIPRPSVDEKESGVELNMHAWLSRASLEFIGQGGLGRSLDSLKEGDMSEHTRAIREVVCGLFPTHKSPIH